MPPPPASHSNPPNFRAGTNRPPAPNVHHKILRGSIVRTHCVASNSAYFARDQYFRRLRREPRKMHFPLRVLISILLRIRPPRSPSCPKQHNRAFQNPPVLPLPLFDV